MPGNITSRRGDGRRDFLEISVLPDGDIFVKVMETNDDGKIKIAHVEFCTSQGGGYHPKTWKALDALRIAMKEDNQDPYSPERYRQEIKED